MCSCLLPIYCMTRGIPALRADCCYFLKYLNVSFNDVEKYVRCWERLVDHSVIAVV